VLDLGAFVPFPDGAQVEILYSLGGETVENRLWFWTDFPPIDAVAMQGLVDGVFDWHTANILPYLSSDLLLGFVLGREWATSGATPYFSTGNNVLGGSASPSHSANVALSVRFRWPFQYQRRKQNKHYVPGIPIDQVDLNTPSAFIQDAMFEGYAALIDAARLFAPGFFWRWVVTSAYSSGSPRSEQSFGECIGPVRRDQIILGQRRKRLPVS